MEIDELPENDERLLRKPEIKRDEMGRFERAWTEGQTIKKRGNNKKAGNLSTPEAYGLPQRGPGRPKGSKNKTTLALKELILRSLDEVGGVEYLKKLAIENSSAFASLLGKVLPSTLEASERSGGPSVVRFERVIVYPNGHREIQGVTRPSNCLRQLPIRFPIRHQFDDDPSEIKDFFLRRAL